MWVVVNYFDACFVECWVVSAEINVVCRFECVCIESILDLNNNVLVGVCLCLLSCLECNLFQEQLL